MRCFEGERLDFLIVLKEDDDRVYHDNDLYIIHGHEIPKIGGTFRTIIKRRSWEKQVVDILSIASRHHKTDLEYPRQP